MPTPPGNNPLENPGSGPESPERAESLRALKEQTETKNKEKRLRRVDKLSAGASNELLFQALPEAGREACLEDMWQSIFEHPSIKPKEKKEGVESTPSNGEKPRVTPENTPESVRETLDPERLKLELQKLLQKTKLPEAQKQELIKECVGIAEAVKKHPREVAVIFQNIRSRNFRQAFEGLGSICEKEKTGMAFFRGLGEQVRTIGEGKEMQLARSNVKGILEAFRILDLRQGFFKIPTIDGSLRECTHQLETIIQNEYCSSPRELLTRFKAIITNIDNEVAKAYLEYQEQSTFTNSATGREEKPIGVYLGYQGVHMAHLSLERLTNTLEYTLKAPRDIPEKEMYANALESMMNLRNSVTNKDLMWRFDGNHALLRGGIEKTFYPQLQEGVFCEPKNETLWRQLHEKRAQFDAMRQGIPVPRAPGENMQDRLRYMQEGMTTNEYQTNLEGGRQQQTKELFASHEAGITELENKLKADPNNKELKNKLIATKEAFYSTKIAWERESFNEANNGCLEEKSDTFVKSLVDGLEKDSGQAIKLPDEIGNIQKYTAKEVRGNEKLLQIFIESSLQSKLLEFQKKIEKPLFLLLKNRLEANRSGIQLGKTSFDATSSKMLETYERLFNPENNITTPSISAKRVMVEEILTLPLSAFLVGKLGQCLKYTKLAVKASQRAKLLTSIGLDFIEGGTFELITQYRQRRGDMSEYSLKKDFLPNAMASALLFNAFRMNNKLLEPLYHRIGIDTKGFSKIMAREGINFTSELSLFTAGEAGVQKLVNDKDIFEDGVIQKLLTNAGIVALVKSGYRLNELSFGAKGPGIGTYERAPDKQFSKAEYQRLQSHTTKKVATENTPKIRDTLGIGHATEKLKRGTKMTGVDETEEPRDMESKGGVQGRERILTNPTADDLISMLREKVLIDAMTKFPKEKSLELSGEFKDLQRDINSLQSKEDIKGRAREIIDNAIKDFIKRYNLDPKTFSKEQIGEISVERERFTKDFGDAIEQKYLKSKEFNKGEKYGKGIEKLITPFVERLGDSVKAEFEMGRKQKVEKIVPKKNKPAIRQ